MHAMSKVQKSNSKNTTRQPLSGLQKAAWWSVPAVGVLFLICAVTIGVLFLTRSDTATGSGSKVTSPAEKSEASRSVTKTELANVGLNLKREGFGTLASTASLRSGSLAGESWRAQPVRPAILPIYF